MTASLSLPVAQGPTVDVLVVGGGVSGSIAAIAAGRAGARVLLVEEQGYLGGTLTSMGVGPMMSFHNGLGEQVVGGLADEVIGRLQRRGASPGHIPDTTTYCSTVTPFDSEELKIELETMLEEAGGQVLFHTQLAAVERVADHIASVIVCNKAGLMRLTASVYIDSTGDADLASRAGVEFVMGRKGDGATQPMTMNLKLANVDTNAIRHYAREHPDDFLWEHGQETGLARLAQSPRISLSGFLGAWREARARGEVEVPRDQVLFFETATPGVVIVNTSRVQGLDPTDPFQLSAAERLGRRQAAQIYTFLRTRCVGFSRAIRMDTAPKIGVRESRHVKALHELSAEDLLGARAFPDAIAMGGYPIDIHSPQGEKTLTTRMSRAVSYQIPLRSLLVHSPVNLIMVGRCVGATHEASAAIRVTPIAMAIGHAGGALAGLAAAGRVSPAEVPFAALRTRLLEQGARLPAEPGVQTNPLPIATGSGGQA